MASVFFSYAHEDEDLRDQLEKQLSILKRQGVIETWHDRRIGAGVEFAKAIDEHIEQDDVILLLVSPDFLDSDYCYDIEMSKAMERHEAGEARVIPVILRPCDWTRAPFGKLNAIPADGRAVTLSVDKDVAFLEVAHAVRRAAEAINGKSSNVAASLSLPAADVRAPSAEPDPRSSNLRLTKEFTERDTDRFKLDSFEFMVRFFENSLAQLAARNKGIEGDFRRIDATRFVASIYRDGKKAASCSVFVCEGFMGNGIAYSAQETTATNSYNEHLSVEADDQSLYLAAMGMAHFARAATGQKLTQEGAAEFYWSMLIAPLQRER